MSTAKPLVVGVGNRSRGDDGIGHTVVEAVRSMGGDRVETVLIQGDLSDLVVRWSRSQDVVLVDAMVSGRPPGSVVIADALATTLPQDAAMLSSHAIGVAEVVNLARLLDRLPRSLRVVAVEGSSFELFASMSDAVEGVVTDVAEQIVELLVSSA